MRTYHLPPTKSLILRSLTLPEFGPSCPFPPLPSSSESADDSSPSSTHSSGGANGSSGLGNAKLSSCISSGSVKRDARVAEKEKVITLTLDLALGSSN